MKNKVREKKSCVVYYGPYVTESAYKSRCLPSLNVACSNRMRRLAEAIRTQRKDIFVIAPGITARTSFSSFLIPKHIERVGNIPIITISQLGFKFLGFLLCPLSAIRCAFQLRAHRKIECVIQYTYYPDAFLFSLACKYFHRSRIIFDFEDVCVPSWRDWARNSETHAVQQIWGWCVMKLSLLLADIVIVPSKKFLPFVRPLRPVLIVTGCQAVISDHKLKVGRADRKSIKMLSSGKISEEHGIILLAEALKIHDKSGNPNHIEVHVCGSGGQVEWFRKQIEFLDNISVCCYGYMTNEEFLELFKDIDVCFILQNPNGRHGHFKTPSKGYESLCAGKTIITSDIGDFSELPDDICYHLKDYSPEGLAQILARITYTNVCQRRDAALTYAFRHWDSAIIGQQLAHCISSMEFL